MTFLAYRTSRWIILLVASTAFLMSVLERACADEGEPAAGGATIYCNPILTPGMPADPHVIRVDGEYYLYPTTHGKGYDAWTSTDLVHWKHRGRVFDDPRGGAWAPDVFHHVRGDGKFYLYYTINDPDAEPGFLAKQIGVAVSDSPLGPFQDEKVLAQGSIDAHLFEDDDGQLYLYYVRIDGGFRILVRKMSDPLTPAGEAVEVIRPTEPWEMVSGHVTEGPFLLKRGDTYYLTYSGTGADSPDYGVGYATSKSPLGPFEKYEGNPIVGRTARVFGPGHHSVVEGPDGKMWMIYHQKYGTEKSFRRFVAIDPIWFDEEGILHARATRGTEEEGPSVRE